MNGFLEFDFERKLLYVSRQNSAHTPAKTLSGSRQISTIPSPAKKYLFSAVSRQIPLLPSQAMARIDAPKILPISTTWFV